MRTQQQIEKFIEKQECDLVGVYGPSRFADFFVWEVWVFVDGEYRTWFVRDKEAVPLGWYADFAQLLAALDEIYATKPNLIAVPHPVPPGPTDHERIVRLYVPAIAFLLCVIGVLWLVVAGREPGVLTYLLLGGVVASGGAMFFGAWQQPTPPSASGA